MAVTVLTEPFDNLTAWTIGSAGAITAGGVVGTFFRNTGSGNRGYPIAVASQSPYYDIDFYWRCSNVGTAARTILQIRSDQTSQNEMTLQVTAAGALAALRGGTTGNVLGTTADGAVVSNTWYRLHLVAYLADSGNVRLDLNGTTVVTVSAVKTYLLTPTAASVSLNGGGSGVNHDFDELLLKTGAPANLDIAVVADNNQGRIIINVTGLDTSAVNVLQRQMPSGEWENVRNAEPIPAGLNAYVVNDWEVPPNATVTYRVAITKSGTTTYFVDNQQISWQITPFPYNARILHPTVPAMSVKTIVSEVAELNRDVRTELHYPLGRPDPVVVAQVRQYPTGQVQLLTLNMTDRKELIRLLGQAAVFCLQTNYDYDYGAGQMWIAAGPLVERRTGWPMAQTDLRVFELQIAQVGRPPGLVSSAISEWQAVPAAYATWNAVVAAKASWNALVFGAEIGPLP